MHLRVVQLRAQQVVDLVQQDLTELDHPLAADQPPSTGDGEEKAACPQIRCAIDLVPRGLMAWNTVVRNHNLHHNSPGGSLSDTFSNDRIQPLRVPP